MGTVSSPTFHKSWGGVGVFFALLVPLRPLFLLPFKEENLVQVKHRQSNYALTTRRGIYLQNFWLGVSSLITASVPSPATVSTLWNILNLHALPRFIGLTRKNPTPVIPLHLQCICSGAGEKARKCAGWSPCKFTTPNLK